MRPSSGRTVLRAEDGEQDITDMRTMMRNLTAAVAAADRMTQRRYFWPLLWPLSAAVTGVSMIYVGVALSLAWWDVAAWFTSFAAWSWLPTVLSQVAPAWFGRCWPVRFFTRIWKR